MKYPLCVFLAAVVVGCSASPAVQVTPPPSVQVYHPQSPAPVETRSVEWEVLTRQQLLELIEQAERTREPLVLYALREQGFQNLAINIQELKRYILESRAVIDYYRRVLPSEVPGQAVETQTTTERSMRIERSTITPEQRALTEKLYNFAK